MFWLELNEEMTFDTFDSSYRTFLPTKQLNDRTMKHFGQIQEKKTGKKTILFRGLMGNDSNVFTNSAYITKTNADSQECVVSTAVHILSKMVNVR